MTLPGEDGHPLATGFVRSLLQTHLLHRGVPAGRLAALVEGVDLAALLVDGEADAARVVACAERLTATVPGRT